MPDTVVNYLSYFLLGIGLNLTPCVYPMLTITLSLFRGSEEGSRWQSFCRAFLYVSGIVVTYTALGVTAAFTGQFFGGLLQNFWVLLLVGCFIFALSLSMFGFYTFQLPSWLVPQQGASRRSFLGLFLAGAMVGLIAAPCVGPVVLSLLVHIGQEKNVTFGAVSFFLLALGLGTPYMVLGTFTGLLRKLPRSGAWLIWFERALGVVLFSFGCFYLIIAFRWPIMPWLVPLAFLGGGIYLGWLERTEGKAPKFEIFKKVAGSLAAVAGIMMLLNATGVSSKPAMVWEKYRAGILEEAKAAGQPVILDFYADWCIPCHELDQFTYTNPEVIDLLKRFRRIKVDTTSVDTAEIEEVVRKFNVYGIPSIFFMDASGLEVEELRITGFVSPEELLGAVRASRRLQT